MIVTIYVKPYKTDKEDVWLIGWSKTQFEKCKCNIFHCGTYQSAQEKIDSIPGKKYLKRPK